MRNSNPSRPARTVALWLAATIALCNTLAQADDDDAAASKTVATVQATRVQRATIAQPVRAYGIIAASASNLTTVNVPYVARIVRIGVQPGENVKRGTPLAVVQADAAAVLVARQAHSAARLAQGELLRVQSLYDKGLTTQSQLETARHAAQDAQQTLAAQEQTGVAIGKKTVLAPFDGVVLQVSAAQGDQLQPGASIMQLATRSDGDGARANAMLGVEPEDAVAIHVGDPVALHGLAGTLTSETVVGHVVIVGSSVDMQSQLVDIGVSAPLERTPYIPGTRVSADIATAAGTHWVVPRAAVLSDEDGSYVFQVTPQHTAHRVKVAVEVEAGGRYGVEGKLDASQPLVVVGNYELKEGMAVNLSGDAIR
jgi:RND family efflux transporter MFP subunit